jgi:hypothetical protein
MNFAKTMVEGASLGKPTVVRTVETVDDRGRPVTQGYDANNNKVGPAIPKYVAPKSGPAAPAGYRYKRDGSLEAIPGGPADVKTGNQKPPNEFQGKSAGFGARAFASHEILNSMDYSPALANINQAGGALTNWAMPQNVQKVNQAQRDFVNAVLRQESGAAIAESEFENAKKQYFPQPGDKPEVIEQKRQNRERVISSFETNAGPAGYTVRGQGGGGGGGVVDFGSLK